MSRFATGGRYSLEGNECDNFSTIAAPDTKSYGAEGDCHVFTQDHTLNDILRYAVSQAHGDFEEIETLLGLLKDRNDR